MTYEGAALACRCHRGISVPAMLAMLGDIHAEARGELVLADFALTIQQAIQQLRQVRIIALEAMREAEAERALLAPPSAGRTDRAS